MRFVSKNSYYMKSISLFLALVLASFIPFAQTDQCNSINATGGNQSIVVSGISGAPIAGIQVFNSSWASVFNQTYASPPNSITVPSLAAGQYFVNTRLYNSNWTIICEKGQNVTVTVQPPPDNCAATFQKTFGLPGGDEWGQDIENTPDGYIIAGKAAVTGTSSYDGLLMKFSKSGNLLWSKTYGGVSDDLFHAVVTTTDGGFLAAGSTKSAGNSGGDAWLVKTDATGNVLWQRRYTDNSNPAYVYAVTQTSDGGYAFAGDLPNLPGSGEGMLVKIDGSGNVQWQKRFGSPSSDEAVDVIEDNHGAAGLVVTGYNYSPSWYDADITKFDLATGNVLWTKTYDMDNRANRFRYINKVADGFIINGANHDGFDSDNTINVLVKTDFNGNIVSKKEYGIPGMRDGLINPTPDGGYLFEIGLDPNNPNSDIHLMKIDAAGAIQWTKKYPLPGCQWINQTVIDGNYIVGVGHSKSGSYNDILLMKADLSGKLGSCTSVDVISTTRTPALTNMPAGWSTSTLALNSNITSLGGTTINTTANVLCIETCPLPQVTVSNVTVNENADNAVLQVCISFPATDSLRYDYSTANGTANSGSDYTGGSGTVLIAPGQTCGQISIPILNDAIAESTENFTVSIGSVVGTVTINDDDQTQNNCSGVTITPGNIMITVTGVTAPVATIQVFSSSWATVFNQTYTNSPGTVNIPIGPGTYLVKVTFYNSNWTYICDKSENATVINQCPAGTFCVSNICPSQTVNLNTAYSISNLPPGTTVSWHTGTPATDANKMTAAQAQNVSVSGTYYAAINISGANCYSQTIPVNVTIIQCTSAAVVNAVQLKTEGAPTAKNIMVFPNPFNRSLRVVIDSEKKEKASLILTDVLGRQLKTLPVQLIPGSNTFLMEGLSQFPSGNYFLTIQSSGERKTLKLMRQQ